MTQKPIRLAALAAILALWASAAQADFIQWNIDPSLSKVSLKIPDTIVNLPDAANAGFRIRNQTGSSSIWNTGNSAAIDGTLNSLYSEIGSHQIQFLSNPTGQVFGINSGNYRPNPAAYNSANTNTANPDGQFQNASSAPAVYGMKMQGSYGFSADLAYVSLYNTSFDLTSSPMPVSGFFGGSFDPVAGGTSFGVLDSSQAVDGLNAFLIGQQFPDELDTVGSAVAPINNGVSASITSVGFPHDNYRRLNLSMTATGTIVLGGIPLTMTTTTTIVAFATVPEPSTFAMSGLGLTGLAAYGWRSKRPRSARVARSQVIGRF